MLTRDIITSAATSATAATTTTTTTTTPNYRCFCFSSVQLLFGEQSKLKFGEVESWVASATEWPGPQPVTLRAYLVIVKHTLTFFVFRKNSRESKATALHSIPSRNELYGIEAHL